MNVVGSGNFWSIFQIDLKWDESLLLKGMLPRCKACMFFFPIHMEYKNSYGYQTRYNTGCRRPISYCFYRPGCCVMNMSISICSCLCQRQVTMQKRKLTQCKYKKPWAIKSWLAVCWILYDGTVLCCSYKIAKYNFQTTKRTIIYAS